MERWHLSSGDQDINSNHSGTYHRPGFYCFRGRTNMYRYTVVILLAACRSIHGTLSKPVDKVMDTFIFIWSSSLTDKNIYWGDKFPPCASLQEQQMYSSFPVPFSNTPDNLKVDKGSDWLLFCGSEWSALLLLFVLEPTEEMKLMLSWLQGVNSPNTSTWDGRGIKATCCTIAIRSISSQEPARCADRE